MLPKDDFKFYFEQLENIQHNLGYGAMIFIILLSLILFFAIRYVTKNVEKAAESASEKILKKYQADLDKDNFKFQTMHQNQIDAIHKVYKEFNNLNLSINYLLHGENFLSPPNSRDLINHIIDLRHSFKKEFLSNKLLFSKELGVKIESLVLEVDNFIETFSNGLFPEMSEEHNAMNAELNGGFVVEGLWRAETFDPLLESMANITSNIEDEFRTLVGTHG